MTEEQEQDILNDSLNYHDSCTSLRDNVESIIFYYSEIYT
jgi:hypothetical protein